MATTKTVDSKGRINLGARFANKTVIIEDIDDTEVRIVAATAIPDRELWLHRNAAAMDLVQTGLAQAKSRAFSKSPPNVGEDVDMDSER